MSVIDYPVALSHSNRVFHEFVKFVEQLNDDASRAVLGQSLKAGARHNVTQEGGAVMVEQQRVAPARPGGFGPGQAWRFTKTRMEGRLLYVCAVASHTRAKNGGELFEVKVSAKDGTVRRHACQTDGAGDDYLEYLGEARSFSHAVREYGAYAAQPCVPEAPWPPPGAEVWRATHDATYCGEPGSARVRAGDLLAREAGDGYTLLTRSGVSVPFGSAEPAFAFERVAPSHHVEVVPAATPTVEQLVAETCARRPDLTPEAVRYLMVRASGHGGGSSALSTATSVGVVQEGPEYVGGDAARAALAQPRLLGRPGHRGPPSRADEERWVRDGYEAAKRGSRQWGDPEWWSR